MAANSSVSSGAVTIAEATAVTPEGRISPEDVGLWNDAQRDAWAPIAAAIREAMQAKEEGTPKTILFNLSGNGVIDLYAYEQYLAGALKDYAPGDAEIAKTVSRLEQLI